MYNKLTLGGMEQDIKEWYVDYPQLKGYLMEHTCHGDKIIIPGCGKSLLAEDMAKDGFTDIWAFDYVQDCVDFLNERLAQEENSLPSGCNLSYSLGDSSNMDNLEDSSIDVVLDKGLLDAVVTGKSQLLAQTYVYALQQ
jgi:2-polyprenyl-3-methyl-5-hydroxy-6-metoxy-1,4-benzoquinol methylase